MAFFKNMFKDDNDINEKSVVGFASNWFDLFAMDFGTKVNNNPRRR